MAADDKIGVTPEPSRSKSLLAALVCTAIMVGLWVAASVFALSLPPTLTSVVLLIALSVVCWFDIDHFRIPDWITFPLIALGLLEPLVWPSKPFLLHLAGAAAGYGLIWALNAYWKRFRGREGIGMGDAKLLAGAGAWLGLPALPIVTLVASSIALVWILLTRSFRSGRDELSDVFPFGPFLSIGFFAVWVFQKSLPF